MGNLEQSMSSWKHFSAYLCVFAVDVCVWICRSTVWHGCSVGNASQLQVSFSNVHLFVITITWPQSNVAGRSPGHGQQPNMGTPILGNLHMGTYSIIEEFFTAMMIFWAFAKKHCKPFKRLGFNGCKQWGTIISAAAWCHFCGLWLRLRVEYPIEYHQIHWLPPLSNWVL